jgi:hypothetical protein
MKPFIEENNSFLTFEENIKSSGITRKILVIQPNSNSEWKEDTVRHFWYQIDTAARIPTLLDA